MEVLLFTTRLAIIACRHMVPLYQSGDTIKLQEIAAEYGFNVRSLHPSFTALTKAGILQSRVGGRYEDRGYFFAKDPKSVTLYDIVETLEGDPPTECCRDILTCKPSLCGECSIHAKLQQVVAFRKKILSSSTIYDHYIELRRSEKRAKKSL